MKTLSRNLIIGYANWNQCDDSMIDAVIRGVNVIIWFSIDLAYTNKPVINRGPSMECVSRIYTKLESMNLNVVHLISIGGWNAPHISTRCSAKEMYETWKEWNHSFSFPGFDGFDWDIEGNDDLDSPYNHFSIQELEMMGEMSQLAKRDGYIVSMAPAETYLYPNPTFDEHLNHTLLEWKSSGVVFPYHGLNCYAYLVAYYGTTLVNEEQIATFDFITIQFYEGYSKMLYYTRIKGIQPHEYLVNELQKYYNGWDIDFPSGRKRVHVKPTQFVIGLANAWADNQKFLFLNENELNLIVKEVTVRGYAFWNLKDEGILVNDQEFYLASILKKMTLTLGRDYYGEYMGPVL